MKYYEDNNIKAGYKSPKLNYKGSAPKYYYLTHGGDNIEIIREKDNIFKIFSWYTEDKWYPQSKEEIHVAYKRKKLLDLQTIFKIADDKYGRNDGALKEILENA